MQCKLYFGAHLGWLSLSFLLSLFLPFFLCFETKTTNYDFNFVAMTTSIIILPCCQICTIAYQK